MVMDTRKRDKTELPLDYHWDGSFQPDTGYVVYAAESRLWPTGVKGSVEEVVSERSDFFIPGKFRANPCILRKTQINSVKGMAYANKDGPFWYRLLGDFWFRIYWNNTLKYLPGVYPEWNQNEANLSQVKAEAKLSEAEWNATCSLGELAETFHMLKDPLQNIAKLFGYLSMPNKLAKQLKMYGRKVDDKLVVADYASGSWLLYRYGINPLIQDIVAGIKYFETKLQQKIEGLQRCSGGQTVEDKVEDTQISTLGSFSWRTRYMKRTTRKTISHVYYEQKLLSDLWFTLKSLGAHPSQIPANIWEWTWLSFTVDWWLSVGNWLQAITPAPGVNLKGRCVSQKVTETIDIDVTSITYPTGLRPEVPVVLPFYRWHIEQLERRVVTTPVVLPPFNPNFFKIERALDTVSLIWTLGSNNLKRIKHAS